MFSDNPPPHGKIDPRAALKKMAQVLRTTGQNLTAEVDAALAQAKQAAELYELEAQYVEQCAEKMNDRSAALMVKVYTDAIPALKDAVQSLVTN